MVGHIGRNLSLKSAGAASDRKPAHHFNHVEAAMLSWALMFLILAIIAGVLGFGVVAGTAAWIAKVLFVVFLVLLLVSLFTGRRTPI